MEESRDIRERRRLIDDPKQHHHFETKIQMLKCLDNLSKGKYTDR